MGMGEIPWMTQARPSAIHPSALKVSKAGVRGLWGYLRGHNSPIVEARHAAAGVLCEAEGVVQIWNPESKRWELFVWLTDPDFEVLSNEHAEPVIQAWVDGIDCSCYEEESEDDQAGRSRAES